MAESSLQTTIDLPRGQVALGKGFTLTVTAGKEAGATFVAKKDRTVIGSGESADLVLSDRSVSRFHCELCVAEDKLLLRDLGSKNGTVVGGVRVLAAEIESGAIITIGRTQVRVDVGATPLVAPLSDKERFGVAIGRSVPMRRVFAILERAAKTDATVLLEGETGTGKEIIADSIHRESVRADGPFVVIDCSAIPRDLLESELFGHEKGSFTGATGARTGAFEAATGGTLFLDEIGELSPELQPKLLRALEARRVKRVGSNDYVDIDVRVVAATNRNLREQVNSSAFRSDLYYRLAVVEVRLPPLRERLEDLPLLVAHIADRLGVTGKPDIKMLQEPEFLAEVARHAWPGNVRELRNYVERCLTLQAPMPLASTPPDGALVDLDLGYKLAKEKWSNACERKYLEGMLAKHGGNVAAAARTAGIDRIYFYRLLWRHGLR